MCKIKEIICDNNINYLPKIKDESIHIIITSPPYNVSIDYDNYNDNMEYEKYLDFLENVWKECYRILVKGGRICINIPSINIKNKYLPLYSDIIQQMKKIGFIMRNEIIWNKNNITKRTAWGSFASPSNPYLLPPYEFILVFSKEKMKLEGDKEKIDIQKNEFIEWTNCLWTIKPETEVNHPAPFPKNLVARLLKLYSYKNNIALDPFAGSGTVGVVAEMLDRQYILIEQSEKYCQIIKKRISEIKNNLFEKN